jgi:hypothetical protein
LAKFTNTEAAYFAYPSSVEHILQGIRGLRFNGEIGWQVRDAGDWMKRQAENGHNGQANAGIDVAKLDAERNEQIKKVREVRSSLEKERFETGSLEERESPRMLFELDRLIAHLNLMTGNNVKALREDPHSAEIAELRKEGAKSTSEQIEIQAKIMQLQEQRDYISSRLPSLPGSDVPETPAELDKLISYLQSMIDEKGGARLGGSMKTEIEGLKGRAEKIKRIAELKENKEAYLKVIKQAEEAFTDREILKDQKNAITENTMELLSPIEAELNTLEKEVDVGKSSINDFYGQLKGALKKGASDIEGALNDLEEKKKTTESAAGTIYTNLRNKAANHVSAGDILMELGHYA